MRHFFSDYQSIYAEYEILNRHAKKLLNIDAQADPVRFEERLNLLLTGSDEFYSRRVLEEIMDPNSI